VQKGARIPASCLDHEQSVGIIGQMPIAVIAAVAKRLDEIRASERCE
jgi:hypothetical protein